MPSRGFLFLVHLLAAAAQAPLCAGRPGRDVPRGARAPRGPGRGLGLDRRGPRKGAGLQVAARQRGLPALELGRGDGDDRRRPRPHDPPLRPRPDRRLLADPGDVDGLLRCRDPLPLADRRGQPLLLRLVCRPAPGLAADVGRSDRRAGVGGLVELLLPDAVGLQHPADADAGRPLHDRGALPRAEGRGDLPRLRRPHQVRRPLAARARRYRRRPGDGDGARDPQGVLPRAAGTPLPGLRPPLHRPALPRPPARSTATAPTAAGAFLRASDLGDASENAEWRTVVLDADSGEPRRPERHDRRPLGRGGEGALEPRPGRDRAGADVLDRSEEAVEVVLPRFDGGETEGGTTMRRGVPAVRVGGALVTTVFDLAMAQSASHATGSRASGPAATTTPRSPTRPPGRRRSRGSTRARARGSRASSPPTPNRRTAAR